MPVPHAADPLGELIDLRRRHRAAHRVAVDADSQAVREVRTRERLYRRWLALADAAVAVVAAFADLRADRRLHAAPDLPARSRR